MRSTTTFHPLRPHGCPPSTPKGAPGVSHNAGTMGTHKELGCPGLGPRWTRWRGPRARTWWQAPRVQTTWRAPRRPLSVWGLGSSWPPRLPLGGGGGGLDVLLLPPCTPCGLLQLHRGCRLSGTSPVWYHLLRCLHSAQQHPLLPPPLHRPHLHPFLHPFRVRHPHCRAHAPPPPLLPLTRLRPPLPAPLRYYPLLLFLYDPL